MAKSLRSKWKRKTRAIKRIRYGEKEKAMFEKMLKNTEERKKLLSAATENGTTALEHGPQILGRNAKTKDYGKLQ